MNKRDRQSFILIFHNGNKRTKKHRDDRRQQSSTKTQQKKQKEGKIKKVTYDHRRMNQSYLILFFGFSQLVIKHNLI